MSERLPFCLLWLLFEMYWPQGPAPTIHEESACQARVGTGLAPSSSPPRVGALIDLNFTPIGCEALHPNRHLFSDVDLYRCISFVSIALTIRITMREKSFISGIDNRQVSKSG